MGKRDLHKSLEKDKPNDFLVSVKAGNPNVLNKNVNVKWVDRDFHQDKLKFDNGIDLLPQLEQLSYQGGDWISMATVGADSKFDLANVFRFASDYSTTEWRFIRTTRNKYVLGTKFDDDYSPKSSQLGLISDDEIFASIHSHNDIYVEPGLTFFESEKTSMGYRPEGDRSGLVWGDVANSLSRKRSGKPSYKKYVYVPQSGRLWKVGLTKPHYIRHINGNSERFFFGPF